MGQYRASAHPDSGTDRSYVRADEATAQGDADLRDSLSWLSRLRLGPGQNAFAEFLTHIARFAVQAVPGADGAGVTILADDHSRTSVATAEFIRVVDWIQHGLGEGPCISAAALGRTMRSGSLVRELAWPRFGPRAARLGVHSALSLPLQVQGTVLGAVSVYAHAPSTFTERAAAFGERFARPAAVAVLVAQTELQNRERNVD